MSDTLQGLGVSPGTVIGPVLVLGTTQPTDRAAGTPDEERAAYTAAVDRATAALNALVSDLRTRGLDDQGGILEAQVLMVRDPAFIEQVAADIATGTSSTEAVRAAGEQFASAFETLDDPYMVARAVDVRDAAGRVMDEILGRTPSMILDRPSIIVAPELTPSQTATFDRTMVLGLATETGGATSHSAILARALQIPAVVGVPGIVGRVTTGAHIALDGETGEIMIDPSADDRRRIEQLAESQRRTVARFAANRDLPAETIDGHRVILAANIGSPDDLPAALEAGAEGVGLFRTEFLFAGRGSMPTEAEQVAAYRAVLQAMSPHRVVVRTLDIGGDKPLPYLPAANEANPFLGERGIRYTLRYPEVLRVQLRALTAAAPAGRLSIMLPMVANVAEVHAVLAMLDDIDTARHTGGAPIPGFPKLDLSVRMGIELGIMVEIPATAVLAGQFAQSLDFVSVGTNDLTQYALAVDRGNESVAPLYESLHPGVLRLLQMSVQGAHAHGRWAGVCGEMAGDLDAIPLLLGLGFDELSMTASRVPAARERIRSLSYDACCERATRALDCTSAVEVEALVRSMVSA